MIPGDWANMCQAMWRSPLLPLSSIEQGKKETITDARVGTGQIFKRDLLSYLEAYGNKKTGSLIEQLERYDFGTIRAALIASVPSKQDIKTLDSKEQTTWGWPALQATLSHVPVKNLDEPDPQKSKPQIVIQVNDS